MAYPQNVERWREVVRRASPAALRDDPEFQRIALATIMAESGGDPNAVGDEGASVGLFQLHERGLGSGLSRAQRSDPDTNAGRAVVQLASAYRASGGDPARTYIQAINPGAGLDSYQVKSVLSAYHQGAGAGGPKVRASVAAQTAGTGAQVAEPRIRTYWVVPGKNQIDGNGNDTGQPIEYDSQPADGSSGILGIGASPNRATQMRQEIYGSGPNAGKVITYRRENGEWVFEDEATNSALATIGNREIVNARAAANDAQAKADKAADRAAKLEADAAADIRAANSATAADERAARGQDRSDARAAASQEALAARAEASQAATAARAEATQASIAARQAAKDAAALEREMNQPEDYTLGRTRYRTEPDGSTRALATEPRDVPQLQPRYGDEARLGEARAQKAESDLLGPATQALNNHLSLIDQVQKMLADGQLKPEQATAYMATSQQNFQAALKGSNLAEQQEQARADRRAKNREGTDLINQRLQTGGSIASALTSSAFGMAGNPGFMMPAGKSSLGYSPGMLALEMTDKLGGGPEISEFAKQLVMASNEDFMKPQPQGVPGG